MEVLSSRVLFRTPDFDSLRSFYEDVVGLRVYREYGFDGRVTGTVFFLGGGFLEITTGSPASPPVTLWLQVADAAAEQGRLEQAGVTVLKPVETMPWGLIEGWLRDRAGNELRIIEVPPSHPIRRRV